MKSKKFVLARELSGQPVVEDDFRLVEEDLDEELQENEILADAEYIMISAGQLAYLKTMAPGATIPGAQVAKVTKSRNEGYPEGSFIVGHFGWRNRTVINPDLVKVPLPVYVLPNLAPYDRSWALGPLGLPGNTAYFGFLEICQPQEGEVVVVSSAASAVGAHVGQIAKIKKCRTIGITSSDEKCDLIKRAYGFDEAINYKKQDVSKMLKSFAPQGVDCYFDNVGGAISSTVIGHMNTHGRISVCGAASLYDELSRDSTKSCGPYLQVDFILRQLKMEGFVVYKWRDRWMEGIDQNLQWLREGKLNYKQKVYENFETMPAIIMQIMKSSNMAKCVVKLNDFS